jgi:hypothetical protein
LNGTITGLIIDGRDGDFFIDAKIFMWQFLLIDAITIYIAVFILFKKIRGGWFMKKRGLFVLLAVAQIFVFAHCVRAEERTGEEHNIMLRPLVGITELEVVVEELSEDAKKINLTVDDIQRIVELKLRMAGTKVVSEAENTQTVDEPYVYVTVNVSETGPNLFYANLRMEIVETDCLQSGSTCDDFTTYHRGRFFSVEKNIAGQWIRDNLKEVTGFFLNDYFRANPRTELVQPIQ